MKVHSAKVSNPGGDRIHNPDHYNWKGEECIYLIRILCRGEEGFDGYCKGNILKYNFQREKEERPGGSEEGPCLSGFAD